MLGPRSDQHDPVVIVGAARTAMGALQGALADFSALELGAVTIRSALARAGVAGEEVSEVLMGAILTAGQGQAPARQAALAAGLPHAVPATTVNKMCGSGMKTVMMAADALLARPAEVIVAGGMESMSKAPYLVPKMRQGARLGHAEGPHVPRRPRGRLRPRRARTRAPHGRLRRGDGRGLSVHARRAGRLRAGEPARTANEDGSFAAEIAPVEVNGRAGKTVIARRAAVYRRSRPHPAAEARVPRGWHGDGGQFELDFRRRRFARADAGFRGARRRGSHRSPASSRPPATRRNRPGTRRLRPRRSPRCSMLQAGARTTSASTR